MRALYDKRKESLNPARSAVITPTLLACMNNVDGEGARLLDASRREVEARGVTKSASILIENEIVRSTV